MIALILFVLGFLLTSGAFGAQVINGFELMQYWLWIAAIISTLFSVIIIGISAFGGVALLSNYNKLPMIGGAIVGGVFGATLSLFILFITYSKLWLSYYIIEHIPQDAVNFEAFPQEAQYAIYGFIAIWAVGFIRSLKPSNRSK